MTASVEPNDFDVSHRISVPIVSLLREAIADKLLHTSVDLIGSTILILIDCFLSFSNKVVLHIRSHRDPVVLPTREAFAHDFPHALKRITDAILTVPAMLSGQINKVKNVEGIMFKNLKVTQ